MAAKQGKKGKKAPKKKQEEATPLDPDEVPTVIAERPPGVPAPDEEKSE